MKNELAQASAEKLSKDPRVDAAKVDRNDKGILVRVQATDSLAARDLRGDLSAYPVYVDVES